MTRPSANFIRLLVALEEFAAQESLQLTAGDITAVRLIQERAAPVVAELVRLGRDSIPGEVHSRLVAVVDRRLRNQEFLDSQINRLREALGQTRANLRRIGQIAPVYGRQPKSGRANVSGATRAVA